MNDSIALCEEAVAVGGRGRGRPMTTHGSTLASPGLASPSFPPAALAAENVTKTYRMGLVDVHALRGITFRVEPGELVAIMGPSGSGKSSLLHALAGLMSPSSGRVLVEGRELSSLTDAARTDLRRRRIGVVFQKFNLMPGLTVDANLKLAQRISLGRDEARSGAGARKRSELLELLGLGDKLGRRPSELSGGEQQRVALARAVIHRPAILLADEPTGNLDSTSSSVVLEMLGRIHRELGQTIVIITHDIDVAEAASRLVLMKDGRIHS